MLLLIPGRPAQDFPPSEQARRRMVTGMNALDPCPSELETLIADLSTPGLSPLESVQAALRAAYFSPELVGPLAAALDAFGPILPAPEPNLEARASGRPAA